MVNPSPRPVVLAAAAHPDDIEFCFAGTLLQLKEAGCDIHMWALANGCCGTTTHSREEIARIRWEEARASAAIAGATAHAPLFDDLAVFYDRESIARVSGVVRSIRPTIILTHALQDYMEDHQNVARLIVSAAFSRGMPNHQTSPECAPYNDPVRLYHAAPHGLHDGMGTPFAPDFLVNIDSTLDTKREMLACHQSQSAWLQDSQKMNAYLDEMISMGQTMAQRTPFGAKHAEGWRRHSHLGFCDATFDPIQQLLSDKFHPVSKPSLNH